MTHPTRREQVAATTTEALVQGILALLERTYTTTGRTGPDADLGEFFRVLDDATLRAIAYQHGVVEGAADAEPEREDRDQT